MAQNEDMKRLINNGEPAGYQRSRIINERVMIIEHSPDMKEWIEVAPYMVDDYQDWIKHDSFELGIKMLDGTWLFAGDIIKQENHIYELCYLPSYGGWWLKLIKCNCTATEDCPSYMLFQQGKLKMGISGDELTVYDVCYERIGSIHDKPDTDHEVDVVLNLPSPKTYPVKMNVRSVKKGKPKLVDPDEEEK